MPLGKVGPTILKKYILSRIGPCNERILVGPAVGEDSAIVDLDGLGDSYMVVSSDPISGAEAGIGRYAVHVNGNDVATSGARPSIFICNIMMRRSASTRELEMVFSEITEECSKLDISIVGGHTEVSPIDRTIVSSTMIGFAQRNRLARRPVKEGDVLVLTKGAGIEGTSIIAAKKGDELADRLGRDLVDRAKKFSSKLSVVPEAMIAADLGVRRMHDPTEGGVIGGLLEMCVANRISVRVDVGRIPVPPETGAICDELGIDPLKLIGSGSLLCIFPKSEAYRAIKRLDHHGIPAADIGHVKAVGDQNLALVKDSREEIVTDFPLDELWGVIV